MPSANRILFSLAAGLAVGAAGSFLVGTSMLAGPLLLAALGCLAGAFGTHPFLRHFAFTLWVVACCTAAFLYPDGFLEWGGVPLSTLIVPLIQIIMFGMGCTLSPADFGRVFRMPWPVLVGLLLQFSVMPLAGLGLAVAFGFEPAVAAGIVLVGACPGGVASNLMTYLARGNVALSVTMTACSTLASPLLTPLLMQHLAGQFLVIDFLGMLFGILDMIIVPIAAGLLAHQVLYAAPLWFRKLPNLVGLAAAALAAGAIIHLLLPEDLTLAGAPLPTAGLVFGCALIGVVALAQGILKFVLGWPGNWMDRVLPIVCMAAICYILAIMIARSRDALLEAGFALLAVAILHNAIGYLFGYTGGRVARLPIRDCRTLAIEVGLQNSGMATGLALNVLKSIPATLGPIVFGIWMNLSGSLLAAWWHRKSLPEPPPPPPS